MSTTTKGPTAKHVKGRGKASTKPAAGSRYQAAKNPQVKMGTKSSGGARTGKC